VGWVILHDAAQSRAVLYDTTSERPLPIPGFMGATAYDEAEDFTTWLGRDPRAVPAFELEDLREEWADLAFDDEENFVGTEKIRGDEAP
jgi:hypothetical protein